MDAAGLRVAGVVSTGVLIVAVETSSGHTTSFTADVRPGASIAVTTRLFIGYKLAPGIGVARIVGAGIQVCTAEGPRREALAEATCIVEGADVIVRAGSRIKGVDAAIVWAADLRGAEILIVTVEQISTDTSAKGASVVFGAGITIIAVSGIVGEDAT